jgi:ABC-type nitrate/sulfonate/bicarbonate transport system permease component
VSGHKSRPSEAPPFRTGNVEWRCWITSDGHRYVWRGAEDRLLVGRYEGKQLYWAKVNGQILPKTFRSLRIAMMTAYRALVMGEVRVAR